MPSSKGKVNSATREKSGNILKITLNSAWPLDEGEGKF